MKEGSIGPVNVDVVVMPESFQLTTGGAVTGQLWLHFAMPVGIPRAVPEANWFDFPVPVLSWWLEALARVASGSDAALRFMDGPYVLALMPSSAGLLLFRGEGFEEEAPVASFEASLRAAAMLTLAECERRGWSSRDILELRQRSRAAR
ncbi:MAG TPA: hypothetical protein VFK04_05025 [Gemmatimonadaceae bacterium]|nr:hypothetical protein [Gemmatimonadaceae bacterium]